MMLSNTFQRNITLLLTVCFLAIFDYATAQAPLINSFSPVIAKAGDTIILTGSNFNHHFRYRKLLCHCFKQVSLLCHIRYCFH